MSFLPNNWLWPRSFSGASRQVSACVCLLNLLWLSGLCAGSLQAQNLCDPAQRPTGTPVGGFTATATRGCVPFAVNLTPIAGISNDQYTFAYDGKGLPTTGTSSRSNTYSAPGSFTILQTSSSTGTGAVACLTVEVLPTTAIDFTVTSCGNRVATVKFTLDATTSKYDFIDIDWGDGTPVQTIPVTGAVLTATYAHTYPAAKTYIVNPRGRYTNLACQSQTATKAVSVQNSAVPTAPVITQISTNADRSFSLNYQAQPGTTVTLAQKTGGTYRTISTNQPSTGIFGVPGDGTVQCFQLTAQDGCGLTQTSDEVCSIVLSATAVSKQNDLSWQPYAGTGSFRSYGLVRDGTTTLPVPGATLKATGSYQDANKITCQVPYCYVLTANTVSTTIVSAPVCVTGINQDAPTPPTVGYVSVESEQLVRLQVSPTSTTNYTMLVGRADNPKGPFVPVSAVVSKNVYQDTDVNPSQQAYCYRVTFRNGCGLESVPGPSVCTVWLHEQPAVGFGWTAESPFLSGAVATYTLEVSDTLGNASQQIDVGGSNFYYEPDPKDLSQQLQRYRIVAVSANGGILSYSNYFTFRRDPKLFVPDVFTPNGDGINPTFVVKGTFLDNFTLTIFDRWGSVVFQGNSPSAGWDGTYNGAPVPVGPYLYKIRVVDSAGGQTVKTGTVTVLR